MDHILEETRYAVKQIERGQLQYDLMRLVDNAFTEIDGMKQIYGLKQRNTTRHTRQAFLGMLAGMGLMEIGESIFNPFSHEEIGNLIFIFFTMC